MTETEANDIALTYAKAKVEGTPTDGLLPEYYKDVVSVLDATVKAYTNRIVRMVQFEDELEFTRQLAEIVFGPENVVTQTLSHLIDQYDRIVLDGSTQAQ